MRQYLLLAFVFLIGLAVGWLVCEPGLALNKNQPRRNRNTGGIIFVSYPTEAGQKIKRLRPVPCGTEFVDGMWWIESGGDVLIATPAD